MTVQGPTGGSRSSLQTRLPTETRPTQSPASRAPAGQSPARAPQGLQARNQDSFVRSTRPQGPDLTGASRQTPLAATKTPAQARTQGVSAPSAGDKKLPPRSVDVPVHAGDTQWDVVTSSLPLLAQQAGLSPEGQKAFAEKWATRLEEAGETQIYTNKTGAAVGAEDFHAGINKDTANPAAGNLGTYRLEFTSPKHDALLKDLQTLQQNQSLVAGIQDGQLRREVLTSLNALSVGGVNERTGAAQNLTQMAQPGRPEANKVEQLIKALASQPELQMDPVVQMARLRMEVDRQAQLIGPPDPALSQALRNRALELVSYAEKGDFGGEVTYNSQTPVVRGEAAWVNKEAGRILEQFGDKAGARHREMMSRFYEVDASERRGYESGMNPTIGRWKDNGQDFMRATLPEEQERRTFNDKNPLPGDPVKELGEDPQKREYKGTNKYELLANGRMRKMPEQVFQQEGALKTEGVKLGARQSPVSSRPQAPFESQNLNPRGTARAMGASGAVGLTEEVNKWGSFLGDLYNNTTAGTRAERERLMKAEKSATSFPVPPTPERLPQFRQRMTEIYGPAKTQVMMKPIEELSHAFYGRQAVGAPR